MTFEHTNLDELKGKFEDGDRPIGEDFARLLDSCHNTLQDTDVGITRTLTVSGETSFNSSVGISSSLSVGGALGVTGSTVLHSTLGVSDTVSFNGALGVVGAVGFGSTLSVSGPVNLSNSLVVSGSTSLHDGLAVIGATLLRDSLDVLSDTRIISLTASGSTVLTDTLSVTKGVVLQDTVDIAGHTAINAPLDVLGLTELSGTTINGTLQTKGFATFDSNVHIKGNLRVDGNAYLSAGSGGNIHVGDTDEDNLIFNADIASDVNLDSDKTYDLGSTTKRWKNVYVADIDVDGLVDGRDISDDGQKLDSVSSTVDTGSANWTDTYTNVSSFSANRDSVYSSVNNTSAQWNSVYTDVSDTSAQWNSVYTDVSETSGTWNDVHTNVNVNSANWDELYTTAQANSSAWYADTIAELTDVDVTGALNDSILVYSSSIDKWVVTTQSDNDLRATATLEAITHNGSNIDLDNKTLILTDNDRTIAARTVTFTTSAALVTGTYVEVDDSSYVYGVSGLDRSNLNGIAEITTNVIELARINGDISIAASVTDAKIRLTQLTGGPGGNTEIAGTATGNTNDALFHGVDGTNNHNPKFTGGESVDNFESLNDTPGSYAGNAGNFVKVNTGEDALEFISHPTDEWDSVYSFVNGDSATNNTDYNQTVFLKLSGDVMTGGLTVQGDISATGDIYLSNDSLNFADGETFSSTDSVNVKGTYASVTATSGEWDSVYASVTATSGEWDSVYSSVSSTSANWDSVYSSVTATSGEWDSVYTDVSETSGEWDSVYSSVTATSGEWDSVYTDVSETSGEWDSVYASVSSTSGEWDSVYTDVSETSGEWDSVYTDVSNTSGEWNSVYSYINTASGFGLATVDAQGKLLTTQIPELSITRVHAVTSPSEVAVLNPGNGIQSGDVVVVSSTHDNLIAVVDSPTGTYTSGTGDYVGYAKLALPDGLVQTVNGKQGPSVVLNSDDFDDAVTAHKFVSAVDKTKWNLNNTTVHANSGSWIGGNSVYNSVLATSADWNSVHASVLANSGSWIGGNSVYNSVLATSADWNNVHASVLATSAEWDSTHTSVLDTSANWDNVYTDVSNTSAKWNDVYSFVNSDSATNNTDYNQTHFVNASGDTITGKLEIESSELEVGGNITMAGDLIHQDDTGTKISFNTDIITLEANGQEFITIDGTAPTPDTVIINEAATTPVNFIIKTPSNHPALYFRGSDGSLGLGTSSMNVKLAVVGGISASEGIEIEEHATIKGNTTLSGSVDVKSTLTGVSAEFTGSLSTTGEMISAGVPLHEIFSTDVDIWNDLTVHGSISATESLSATDIVAKTGYHTLTGADVKVTGITQDINIGGHVLHIVNGLIVEVTDE